MQALVLDTNVVLDLLVFRDPTAIPIERALAAGEVRWIATTAMRDDLDRVLAYPQLAARLLAADTTAGAVLAAFDARAQLVESAARAPVTCADPDDQAFIDLALRHRAVLLSKDSAVLSLARRLAPAQVTVAAALPAAAVGVA